MPYKDPLKRAEQQRRYWQVEHREEKIAYLKEYRKDDGNKQKAREASKRWRKENPRKFFRQWLHWNYGITVEEFDRMVVEQEGRCKLCIRALRLKIDHDH